MRVSLLASMVLAKPSVPAAALHLSWMCELYCAYGIARGAGLLYYRVVQSLFGVMLPVALLLLLLLMLRWLLVTVLLMTALLFLLMPHWKKVQEAAASGHQCYHFRVCLDDECLLAPSVPHTVVAVPVADHHLSVQMLHEEAPSSYAIKIKNRLGKIGILS